MKNYIIITILLVIFCAFAFFSIIKHESLSEEEVSFVLNKPYINVVKSLSTKESLEKAIETNNAKLCEKYWEFFTIEIPRPIFRIRNYKLEGKLIFFVEKNDKELGYLYLPFEQNVTLNKNEFYIQIKLQQPQSNIIKYIKTIEINPLEDQTKIKIKSELLVSKNIPFFLRKFMDNKVKNINIQKTIGKKKNKNNRKTPRIKTFLKK